MKIIVFISFLIIGCNETNELIQNAKLTQIESYHCYPYNVRMFDVVITGKEEIELEELSTFCKDSEDLYYKNWISFNNLDSLKQEVWIKRTSKCDKNTNLFKQIKMGNEIYFSGCYKLLLNKDKEEYESYDKAVFFNKNSMQIHIFKNLDHHPFW